MIRLAAFFIATLLIGVNVGRADDGLGLQRGGSAKDVSISGVSAGAAMALQYAVAHSASIVGVGSIAGPSWGCADGRVSQAINNCMCARQPVVSKVAAARALASGNDAAIDRLVAGKPQALKRSYVFHSTRDRTVAEPSGTASIDFLAAFIGKAPVVDRGNASDGSDHAGHGIVSPDGTDACSADRTEATYVRRCGADDNAGKLLLALYGQGAAYDAGKRVNAIPASEVWQFDQQRLIDDVKKDGATVASDRLWLGIWPPYKSSRRKNFDMAENGYLYVPPSCRHTGSSCRIHIALHGCKQDAKAFATTAGYNNWAEHYKVIVVYPAVKPDVPQPGEVCRMEPVSPIVDSSWAEPNANGCWDWWGYLDTGLNNRYLTKQGPQLKVIERVIAEVTRPTR